MELALVILAPRYPCSVLRPAGGDEAAQLLRVTSRVRAGDAAGPELQRGEDLRHGGAADAVPPHQLQEQGRDPGEAPQDRGRRAEVHGGRGAAPSRRRQHCWAGS